MRTLLLMTVIAFPMLASAQRQPPDSVGHKRRWVAVQWGVREQRGPELGPVKDTERQGLFGVVAQVRIGQRRHAPTGGGMGAPGWLHCRHKFCNGFTILFPCRMARGSRGAAPTGLRAIGADTVCVSVCRCVTRYA